MMKYVLCALVWAFACIPAHATKIDIYEDAQRILTYLRQHNLQCIQAKADIGLVEACGQKDGRLKVTASLLIAVMVPAKTKGHQPQKIILPCVAHQTLDVNRKTFAYTGECKEPKKVWRDTLNVVMTRDGARLRLRALTDLVIWIYLRSLEERNA